MDETTAPDGAGAAAGRDPGAVRADALDGPVAGWRVRVLPRAALPGDLEITVSPGHSAGHEEPLPLVDGERQAIFLDRRDETRAVLVEGDGSDPWRTPILFGPPRRGNSGSRERELVVDGWRVEVEVEQAQRAALRERARVLGAAVSAGGPAEVRAIIPGKIVAIDVRPGDAVTAGQRLLVLEAMKMQNELAAPRDGTVERLAVEPGATVERDDLLVVIR